MSNLKTKRRGAIGPTHRVELSRHTEGGQMHHMFMAKKSLEVRAENQQPASGQPLSGIQGSLLGNSPQFGSIPSDRPLVSPQRKASSRTSRTSRGSRSRRAKTKAGRRAA